MLLPRRLLLVAAGSALALGSALAQTRDRAPLDKTCRPPLKFAAGACVAQCPAGYEDRGRVCAYRSTSGGGP